MARPRDNDEFLGFVRRVLAAYGKRIAEGDIDALPGLASLSSECDTALAEAVQKLQADYSGAEIGRRLGVSRQYVAKRWPRKVALGDGDLDPVDDG